ncbi:MAG: carbohydrate binding domain-containing protein [Thermoanaerobaculia bacterium]
MRRNFRTRPTLLGATLAGATLAVALPSAAANILNNGSFETGIGGWTATTSVEWAAEGAAGPGSGSARLRGNPGIVGALALSQCAAVTPGTDYDLGATALLPYSPEAQGGISVRVVWHSWPGCEGATLGLAPALDFPHVAPAVWTRRTLERLRAPAGAASASLLIVPWSSGSGSAFSAFLDDVALSPSSQFVKLTVPTAASVDGANGERFQTTLVLTNPALFTRRVDVTLRCASNAPCATSAVSLLLAPRETRAFADVLLDVFGKRNGAGAIEVTYEATPGPIVVSARAATVHAERPGNGMALPVLPASGARSSATFFGLTDGRAGGGGTRVNAGVYNPSDTPIFVGFSVHEENGDVRNTISRSIAGREWAQIDDLFSRAGHGPATPGSYVTFQSEAPVFPFLISIDNRSGDPTFLEPTESFLP